MGISCKQAVSRTASGKIEDTEIIHLQKFRRGQIATLQRKGQQSGFRETQ